MNLRTLPPVALVAAIAAPLLALPPTPIPVRVPCTTFCLAGSEGPVFGRNYDWEVGVANVTINKRGLMKTALVKENEDPAEWVSKFASLTFNQYGHELPTGGMNEAGLVVEVMWLDETRFPKPDERKGVCELQWVQYQLDNSSSVQEVLDTNSKIRVTQDSTTIHFLVCDREGNQATVEFLNGEMVAHSDADLPIPALTNSTYTTSMHYLEDIEGFGGERPKPMSQSSLDRFVRAACGVVDYDPSPPGETVEYAFGILADVAQGPYTRWSIVYDIENRTVHYKTREAPTVKSVKLSAFDLSSRTPAQILDIDTPDAGDPTALFVDYTTEANRKLIFKSWRSTRFLEQTPEQAMIEVATYPESVRVTGESRSSALGG